MLTVVEARVLKMYLEGYSMEAIGDTLIDVDVFEIIRAIKNKLEEKQ